MYSFKYVPFFPLPKLYIYRQWNLFFCRCSFEEKRKLNSYVETTIIKNWAKVNTSYSWYNYRIRKYHAPHTNIQMFSVIHIFHLFRRLLKTVCTSKSVINEIFDYLFIYLLLNVIIICIKKMKRHLMKKPLTTNNTYTKRANAYIITHYKSKIKHCAHRCRCQLSTI